MLGSTGMHLLLLHSYIVYFLTTNQHHLLQAQPLTCKHLQASSKLLQFEFSLLLEVNKTSCVLVIVSDINLVLGKLIAFVFYIIKTGISN